MWRARSGAATDDRLDFERGPKPVGNRSIATEPGEYAKLQPGSSAIDQGGAAAISLSIQSEYLSCSSAIQDRLPSSSHKVGAAVLRKVKT